MGDESIATCTVDFTADETRLREAKFHIVAVPTPVNVDHTPDLSPVIGASTTLGRNLKEYGVNVQVIDPVADAQEVEEEYGIHLNRLEDISGVDAVIFAVAHEEFINLSLEEIKDWYSACPNHLFDSVNQQIAATIEDGCGSTKDVLIDVKGIFDRKEAEELDYLYWRL
ncbi:MAG: UDP binding domain-containing protein [Syntrophomonas sp.]